MSRFGYCNVLCMWLPMEIVQELQFGQNSVACDHKGLAFFNSVRPLLQQLQWLPVCILAIKGAGLDFLKPLAA